MTPQTGLFADDTAVPPPVAIVSLPALSQRTTDQNLSPAQQRFNRQLARIDALKQQIDALQTLADTQRPLHHRTLHPLRERRLALMRRMALWLDDRLHGRGLSIAHKQTATDMLCALCEHLAAGGDEEMRALHDKHSLHSIEEKQQAAAARVRAMMERALGRPLDTDQPPDSFDDVLLAGLAQPRDAAEADHAQRQHTKARRKPTAAQCRAEQQQQDAESTLRKLYRQLSSALHPDRELDPDSRTHKNALMVEANTAYERRDLVALLHIQLHIEQIDAQALSRMAEEKIESMSLLLSQQTDTLERELDTRRQQMLQEFGLHPSDPLSLASLRRHASREAQALKQDVAAMEHDMRTVRDDASFKRWLKQQKQLSEQDYDPDYLDD
ncbi:MAG: J domain-containing protein [Thiobacillus sp.]|nr:J domain-containing protein [Thiobacillus sp.]